VGEALAAVLGGGAPPGRSPLGVERVALADALGRVLARDVRAPADVPPWANASMDGFAVRAADVRGAAPARPVALRVVGAAYAGAPAGVAVAAGAATRIATGLPCPRAPTPWCAWRTRGPTRRTPGRVLVLDDRDARDEAPAGGGAARRNVRPPGEDVRAGTVAVTAGTRVTPGVVGLLAAVGAAAVDVARRPRVGVLATGDELVLLDRAAEAHAGRAIVSANSYALAALVREAGGEPVDLGIAADTRAAVGAGLARAREAACEVVLTTGGVSVGERDHVRPAVRDAGGAVHFWRVRMRPGGPLACGALPFGTASGAGGDVPWLGLPGNPVSTVVTFALFGRPLLARLAGDARPFPLCMPVTLDEPVRTAVPLTHLLRATLAAGDDGTLRARLTGPQGSGLLSSVARADVLVVVPEDVRELPAGARAWALVTDGGGPAAAEWPAGLWTALPGGAAREVAA
jgi:molybdopterin molybdotransferase